MRPTHKQIAAISAAIHMYLNEGIKHARKNNKTLITPWRHAISDHLPYSHNRQIRGWTGKDQYL